MRANELPASLAEMAEIIGLEAVITLVELRGGITLCVPVRAREDHWLVPHIGFDALQRLVDHYGGEEIEIPRCAAAVRAEMDAEILAKWRAGTSQSALARMYHITERAVRKKIRRAERAERMDHRQPALFGQEWEA